jgi:hypothetical protein
LRREFRFTTVDVLLSLVFRSIHSGFRLLPGIGFPLELFNPAPMSAKVFLLWVLHPVAGPALDLISFRSGAILSAGVPELRDESSVQR